MAVIVGATSFSWFVEGKDEDLKSPPTSMLITVCVRSCDLAQHYIHIATTLLGSSNGDMRRMALGAFQTCISLSEQWELQL